MAESKRVPDATTATLDAYLQALRQSGLVEAAPLEKALAEFHAEVARNTASPAEPTPPTTPKKPIDRADGAALGRFLVGKNLITAWQHRMILEGRFRGFFLGRYRLLRLLGAGGMSQVYLAEHTRMHRRVALKVLSTKLTRERGHLERFLVEARAIAALDHPNIIHAYNVDNDGGVYYLVMQYIEGHDLSRIVEVRGPLPPERAAEFIRQAAEGLAHAHARGLIHRDVKPGNLMVDRSGIVKIADMGLALHVELADNSLTRALGQGLLGTTDYLAPEQALDCHNVDARADIYSLGCTLYFLLTGRPPFNEGTMAQRLMKHQNVEPPKIEALRPDIPAELIGICAKMMAKKPEDRFQNCRQVCAALSRWIAMRNAARSALERADIPEAILAEGSSQSISQVLLATVSPEEEQRIAIEQSPTTVAAPRPTSEPTMISATRVADLYNRRRKKSLFINLGLCAAAAVAVSVGIWVGVSRLSAPAAEHVVAGETKSGEKGWIVFDWPSAERVGAKLLLDGKTVPVPHDGAIEVPAEPGSHSLMIVRPGFPIFERSVNVVSAQRRSIAPWWGGPEAPVVTTPNPPPNTGPLVPPVPPASIGPLLTVTPPKPPSTLDRLTSAALPAEVRPLAESGVPVVGAWGEFRLAHWTPIRTLAVSRQGTLASVSQDAQLKLWSTEEARSLAEWTPPAAEFSNTSALEFHPEGRLLASLEHPPSGKPIIRLRNTATGTVERTFGESASPNLLAFLPGSDILVTSGAGGNLQWWNSANGQAGAQVATGFLAVRQLAVSPSGKWLAVSGFQAPKPIAAPAKDDAKDAAKEALKKEVLKEASVDSAKPVFRSIQRATVDKNGAMAARSDATKSDTTKTDNAKTDAAKGESANSDDKPVVVQGQETRQATIVRTMPKAIVVIFDAVTREVRQTLEAGEGQVMALRFTADDVLATAGSDGKLRLWNVEKPEPIAEIDAHAGPISALAIEPSGQRAATFGGPGALIRLWDLKDERQLAERNNPAMGHVPQRSFEFSPDGKSLFLASYQEARIWKLDGRTLEPAWQPQGHDASVMSAAWQTDGRLLSADVRGRVLAWNPSTGLSEPISKGPLASVASPTLVSPKGDVLAMAGNDQTLRLIDTATGDARASIGPGMLLLASPNGWSFSPEGTLLAASWYSVEAKGFTLSVWNARSGIAVHTQPTPAARIVSLAFSNDGKLLATASQNGAKHEVTLYDTTTWQVQSTFAGHANLIYDVTFSADGTRLATASLDGTARLWKVPEGTPLASLPHESPVVAVDISPDGSRLATLARHGALKVWALASGANTLTIDKTYMLFPAGSPTQFAFGPGVSPVQRMFFAPDGRHVTATCANGSLYTIRVSGR